MCLLIQQPAFSCIPRPLFFRHRIESTKSQNGSQLYRERGEVAGAFFIPLQWNEEQIRWLARYCFGLCCAGTQIKAGKVEEAGMTMMNKSLSW